MRLPADLRLPIQFDLHTLAVDRLLVRNGAATTEIDGLRAQVSWTPDLDPFRYKTDAALAGQRAGQAWVDAELAKMPARVSIIGRWGDVAA